MGTLGTGGSPLNFAAWETSERSGGQSGPLATKFGSNMSERSHSGGAITLVISYCEYIISTVFRKTRLFLYRTTNRLSADTLVNQHISEGHLHVFLILVVVKTRRPG